MGSGSAHLHSPGRKPQLPQAELLAVLLTQPREEASTSAQILRAGGEA